MANNTYLDWVIGETMAKWWHDSSEAAGLQLGLDRCAVGVITNPFLANLALARDRPLWSAATEEVLRQEFRLGHLCIMP